MIENNKLVESEELNFTVPITSNFRKIAERFRQQQASPEKGEQVYWNTLAVLAVDFYCQCMGIETDLEGRDSWSPIVQALADVADLNLKKLGKLECRWVASQSQLVEVPAEVWKYRIGYIAVQLSPKMDELILVGFLNKVDKEEVPLQEWRSLDEFLEHLSLIPPKIHLSQWLHGILDAGWETASALESLLWQPQFAFRSRFRQPPADGPSKLFKNMGVMGSRLISLEQAGEQIAIFVGLTPTGKPEIDIFVELYPVKPQNYLPQDLRLSVINEEGESVMNTIAKSSKNIQLEFSGYPGEQFSVQLTLGNLSILDRYII